MPFTMVAFFLGSLCIIGVPPMGGSWSQWYLAIGAIDADQMIFVVVLMVSSLLSIGYLMPVVVQAFFFEPDPDEQHHGDAHHHDEAHHRHEKAQAGKAFGDSCMKHRSCVLCRCLTATGCIAMFLAHHGSTTTSNRSKGRMI